MESAFSVGKPYQIHRSIFYFLINCLWRESIFYFFNNIWPNSIIRFHDPFSIKKTWKATKYLLNHQILTFFSWKKTSIWWAVSTIYRHKSFFQIHEPNSPLVERIFLQLTQMKIRSSHTSCLQKTLATNKSVKVDCSFNSQLQKPMRNRSIIPYHSLSPHQQTPKSEQILQL